jgi:hypothetical protein
MLSGRLKKPWRAFEKTLAGKKMPAGTRLGSAALDYTITVRNA